ncbi:MAG: iron-containing alcohol dehydrogenase, partial [Campylobacteraceae bacterium]|nr:iron-containing alcohol dehydrogenase [Campylobacteraceae bacterium]
ANSIILPYALKQNESAIENKMIKLCEYLNIKNPSTKSIIEYVLALREKLQIPHTLKEAKISDERAEEIGELAFRDPSTPSNAKKVDANDLKLLFLSAFSGDFEMLG